MSRRHADMESRQRGRRRQRQRQRQWCEMGGENRGLVREASRDGLGDLAPTACSPSRPPSRIHHRHAFRAAHEVDELGVGGGRR